MVESRMGVIAVLNEECVRPRGGDLSFVSKVCTRESGREWGWRERRRYGGGEGEGRERGRGMRPGETRAGFPFCLYLLHWWCRLLEGWLVGCESRIFCRCCCCLLLFRFLWTHVCFLFSTKRLLTLARCCRCYCCCCVNLIPVVFWRRGRRGFVSARCLFIRTFFFFTIYLRLTKGYNTTSCSAPHPPHCSSLLLSARLCSDSLNLSASHRDPLCVCFVCSCSQLATLHADHSAFSRAKLAGPFEFSVRHYAGEVLYHAEGFLDKNRDSVGEACRDLLAKSSVPLVS